MMDTKIDKEGVREKKMDKIWDLEADEEEEEEEWS